MSDKQSESSNMVYSFPRGENEAIQMALTQYKGRYYIDLRLWFQNEGEGTYKPTKKGISFSMDHLIDLKEGVKQLDEACLKIRRESSSPERFVKPAQNGQRVYPKRQPGAWSNAK